MYVKLLTDTLEAQLAVDHAKLKALRVVLDTWEIKYIVSQGRIKDVYSAYVDAERAFKAAQDTYYKGIEVLHRLYDMRTDLEAEAQKAEAQKAEASRAI